MRNNKTINIYLFNVWIFNALEKLSRRWNFYGENLSEIRWKMKQLHSTTDQSLVTPFPFWACQIRWDHVMHSATRWRTFHGESEWILHPLRSVNNCTCFSREFVQRTVCSIKCKVKDTASRLFRFNAVQR